MRTLLLFASTLIFLSSCTTLTPFTQDIYEDLAISDDDIKSVQFYLSQDIVLYKTMDTDEAYIEDGKISLKERQRAKEILIARGTPGVILFLPKEDRFAVSFDNEDGSYLIFGPNERLNDSYTLLGKEWNDGVGKVTYGGEVYTTSSRNAIAALLVNVRKFESHSVKRRQAKGRRI